MSDPEDLTIIPKHDRDAAIETMRIALGVIERLDDNAE